MDREKFGNPRGESDLESRINLSALLKLIKKSAGASNLMKAALTVMAVGAAFMLIRPAEEKPAAVMESVSREESLEVLPEQRMAAILSTVEGAGRVEVMLTLRSDGETEYQTDRQETRSEGESEIRIETVFGSNSADSALVRKKTAPEYLGAVVVAQGADDAGVCYKLAKAVSSLTGLGIDKITILKMGN